MVNMGFSKEKIGYKQIMRDVDIINKICLLKRQQISAERNIFHKIKPGKVTNVQLKDFTSTCLNPLRNVAKLSSG